MSDGFLQLTQTLHLVVNDLGTFHVLLFERLELRFTFLRRLVVVVECLSLSSGAARV